MPKTRAVHTIISAKGVNEFTAREVLDHMKSQNTIYKDSTINTHINSKCCINAPNNHGTVYNDFERVAPGKYKLLNIE
jgi:hypothetical protein